MFRVTKIPAYPNVSGKRNLKDMFEGEQVDIERCEALLMLAGHETPWNVIESWTEDQRRHADNWAFRIYLRASDNAIEQLAKPSFVEEVEP